MMYRYAGVNDILPTLAVLIARPISLSGGVSGDLLSTTID